MEPKINLSFDRFTNNLKKPIRCMQYKEAYVMDYDPAIELSETQEDVFWTAKEIAVEKDVHDIMVNMTEAERHGVITVLKLFTKYEIEAGDSWWGRKVQEMFPRPCIMRMANCFSFIETNVHAPFYNKLNEALHINTEEFYMSYKDDKTLDDRMQFIRNIMKTDDPMIATALFAMIEGVVLYSSFAFLKHFQSKGKNKLLNVVRGINFSVRDEQVHLLGDVFLYKTVYDELKQNSIDLDAFEKAIKQNQELIIQAAKEIYAHEEYVVDMIFESGSIEGITEKQMKNFIQSRINEILNMLDIKPIFKVTYNPIADWFYDGINSYQLHDFFTGIGNQYNRDWDESRFVWVQGELE